MINLRVKALNPDDFGRPRLKNIDTGSIYADVSCGDKKYQFRKYNIAGGWHSTAKDGEPDCPLKSDINFILCGS